MTLSRQTRGGRRQRAILSGVLAGIPVLALTVGVPFANRLEPRILGFPFLIAYLTVWVVLTPAFLYAVNLLWTQE